MTAARLLLAAVVAFVVFVIGDAYTHRRAFHTAATVALLIAAIAGIWLLTLLAFPNLR